MVTRKNNISYNLSDLPNKYSLSLYLAYIFLVFFSFFISLIYLFLLLLFYDNITLALQQLEDSG